MICPITVVLTALTSAFDRSDDLLGIRPGAFTSSGRALMPITGR
jgi:hypothetical protein